MRKEIKKLIDKGRLTREVSKNCKKFFLDGEFVAEVTKEVLNESLEYFVNKGNHKFMITSRFASITANNIVYNLILRKVNKNVKKMNVEFYGDINNLLDIDDCCNFVNDISNFYNLESKENKNKMIKQITNDKFVINRLLDHMTCYIDGEFNYDEYKVNVKRIGNLRACCNDIFNKEI